MDFRARAFLLALTAAASPAARAWAQTPPAAPPPPPIESENPPAAPPPPAPPPPEAPPQEAPPPAPPPPEATPSVPANVPTTWGPTPSEPEQAIVENAARPPVPRPRLSVAIGMGSSFDSVGFSGAHALPSFFTVLGIDNGLFGLDLSAFASSATRAQRMSDAPIDRLAVDLFGVVRPGIWYRPDDRSFGSRVVHALAAELGLGLERDGRSAISGTRLLIHAGARADLPLTPAHEPTELFLRLAVRRGLGLYTPKLYASTGDYTSVTDTAAELYAALVVVF
jgi:hypothetical protein